MTEFYDLAEPAEGTVVLDEVRDLLCRYVVFPRPEAADAVTLFAAATHAVTKLEFAARLVIKSPVKRCGKTRLFDVLAELVREPLATADISAAALVRSITTENPPTIMLDEADAIFGKALKGDEKAEALRGMLNAGFGLSRPYIRWDAAARRAEKCPTFAMAVIAGIGSMPDTIEDRAVIITLRRKTDGEAVEKYRIRRDKAKLTSVKDRLQAWVEPLAEKIGAAVPDMPAGLNDRAEDVWEALLAIADLAGGCWPERARMAARKLSSAAEAAAADNSLSMTLLADLRTVFRDADADRLATADILHRLIALDDSPWSRVGRPPAPLDGHGLAYRLKDFELSARPIRFGEGTKRGYYRAELDDAWQRYKPAEHEGDRNERNERNTAGQSVSGANPVTPPDVTPKHDQGPDQHRYGVTPVTPPPEGNGGRPPGNLARNVTGGTPNPPEPETPAEPSPPDGLNRPDTQNRPGETAGQQASGQVRTGRTDTPDDPSTNGGRPTGSNTAAWPRTPPPSPRSGQPSPFA